MNSMELNSAMHLNPHALSVEHLEKVPTRDGYGQGIVAAGHAQPELVVLCADLTESTRSLAFKKEFPERFVQFGVSEQSLITIATGMALAGKTPWVSSYAVFCPGRSWEQVRTNVALNNVNVKIAGAHAGVSVGPDGATHQALEDMAIVRTIPNMVVIAPADMIETRKAVIAASAYPGPVYVRFAREKSPVFTTEETPFVLGKANILADGKDVALIACGPLVHNALLAAYELAQQGMNCRVINNHTIKPMDEAAVIAASRDCGAIVTIEEHQIQGGMGSRVAEIVAQYAPCPIEYVGVHDRFGESGEPNELIEALGMGVNAIKLAAQKVIGRKRS